MVYSVVKLYFAIRPILRIHTSYKVFFHFLTRFNLLCNNNKSNPK
jgi:hypothetical protein